MSEQREITQTDKLPRALDYARKQVERDHPDIKFSYCKVATVKPTHIILSMSHNGEMVSGSRDFRDYLHLPVYDIAYAIVAEIYQALGIQS